MQTSNTTFWSRLFKYFLLPRDLTSREGSLYVYSSFTDFLHVFFFFFLQDAYAIRNEL